MRASRITAEPTAPPVEVITPTRGWRAVDLREVWRYRGLLSALAWREIQIRYKQTVLGAAWAILQPLLTTGVFTVLFAVLLGRGQQPSVPGVPYVLSTYAAMLPWQLFAHSLTQSANSLLLHQHMITKIYFPRLVLPGAAVLAALADFVVASTVLVGLLIAYGVAPTWNLLALPALVAMALAASLAGGLWLAAMSAIYRDFRHVVPFLVQTGMFVSPVVYTTASLRGRLPDWALLLYGLNPMAGVIEGFRWALFGALPPSPWLLLASLAMTLALLLTSLLCFRRMERTFADVI